MGSHSWDQSWRKSQKGQFDGKRQKPDTKNKKLVLLPEAQQGEETAMVCGCQLWTWWLLHLELEQQGPAFTPRLAFAQLCFAQ